MFANILMRLAAKALVQLLAVRSHFRNRYWRPAFTSALVLLQVHLFLLTVFHHHDSDFFQNRPATLSQGRFHTPPAVDAAFVCTACQIIRHGAMRPSLGPQAPQVASSVPLRLNVLRDDLPSLQKIAAFGRAPPIA
ncbi:MAG TPA: hypothetical protein VKV95_11025 [Terriglobia bacterium]|nr:hypothetical protein [Terriglobia bacterium]